MRRDLAGAPAAMEEAGAAAAVALPLVGFPLPTLHGWLDAARPFPLASPARRARTTLAADFDLLVSHRAGSTPARQRAQDDDMERPRA